MCVCKWNRWDSVMVMWARMKKCEDVNLKKLKVIFVTIAIQKTTEIFGVSSTKCEWMTRWNWVVKGGREGRGGVYVFLGF